MLQNSLRQGVSTMTAYWCFDITNHPFLSSIAKILEPLCPDLSVRLPQELYSWSLQHAFQAFSGCWWQLYFHQRTISWTKWCWICKFPYIYLLRPNILILFILTVQNWTWPIQVQLCYQYDQFWLLGMAHACRWLFVPSFQQLATSERWLDSMPCWLHWLLLHDAN